MKKYKTIRTNTIQGIKKAEWYKSHGWIVINVGIDYIQFYK